jgi:hypothetical protein
MSLASSTARLSDRGRIHPALHIDAHGVVVGIVTASGDYQLVASEGDLIGADDAKAALKFLPRSYAGLAGRWPGEDLQDWLITRTAPRFSDVLVLLLHAFERALEFPRRELRTVFAVWALSTYFYPLFLSFPRLALSGEKESGKSKVLAILQQTAWNALLMMTPTPAVLFRLVSEFRPTLLLDEMEGLSGDDARDIRAILNAGYKAGGTVPRCEGERTKRVEQYEVYAPTALAAIRSLNTVTEDRAIPVTMQRGSDAGTLNAEVDPADPLYGRIRSGGYRLLLERWRTVQSAYRSTPVPPWLNGRARELWRALLAVAAVADAEDELALTADLHTLAREHVEDRAGASAEAEALLAELADRLGSTDRLTVRPGDDHLREALSRRLGWDAPSAEAVGSWLRRLGFRRGGKDRQGARYEVSAEAVREAARRYAPGIIAAPQP